MPNPVERGQQPDRREPREVPEEVYVVRNNKVELLEFFNSPDVVTIYRVAEDARAVKIPFSQDDPEDIDGTIYIRSWYPLVKRRGQTTGEIRNKLGDYAHVSAEDYSLLSDKPWSAESYLNRLLATKRLHEIRINQVRTEDGAVRTGIRQAENIIARLTQNELPQMQTVRAIASELLAMSSAEFALMSNDQIAAATDRMHARLENVGFKSEGVLIEEKRKAAFWLSQAVSGRDSLGRINDLITQQALVATIAQAFKRTEGVNEAIVKWSEILEALRAQNLFCRGIFEDVQSWVSPGGNVMSDLALYPLENRNINRAIGKMRTLQWKLEQSRVRPYRNAGRRANKLIGEAIEYLESDVPTEANARLGMVRNLMQDVLREHAVIHPDG